MIEPGVGTSRIAAEICLKFILESRDARNRRRRHLLSARAGILDISDNSQDATLIGISAGGEVGWAECDASPLPSLGALVGPMSHVARRPVIDSVLGEALNDTADIARINQQNKARSLDLLQADHV